MIEFDPLHYPYASTRNVVYAKNGMCCAGNPSAASAGLQTLLKGGNAIDAAVAMALAQPVVEPSGNGLGCECFAIVWYKGKMYGINGSGPAPRAASIDALKARGFDKIPMLGVEPIDVPGAVATWCALHEKFGSLDLETVAEPAARYAEDGYPVSPNISRLWDDAFKRFAPLAKERPEFEGWMKTFAPQGHPLRAGEIFRSQAMADTIRSIAKTNGRSFYTGEIAERTDAFMKAHNGFLTGDDLAAYAPEWVNPISVNYRGVDVWELPPNGHGITVLMALQILKGMELGDREDPARLVFTSKEGPGIATSLIDLGNRFRLIINDVECKKVERPMPKLPVATNFWTPKPDMYTGAEAWILAGGSHHTAFTYDLTAEQMGDWAAAMGIEAVYIDEDTKIRDFKRDLMLGEVFYK